MKRFIKSPFIIYVTPTGFAQRAVERTSEPFQGFLGDLRLIYQSQDKKRRKRKRNRSGGLGGRGSRARLVLRTET